MIDCHTQKAVLHRKRSAGTPANILEKLSAAKWAFTTAFPKGNI